MSTESQEPGAPSGQGESAEAAQPPAPEADVETLRAELEEANREKSQFKAMAQRAQADLLNYKRRVDEEREELARSAAGRFILRLLPLLDDLRQAVHQAPATAEESAWLEGARLVERSFRALLESEGVTPIEVEVGKPFDPWEHEALLSVESDTQAPGTVVSVVRRGYKHRGRVLRAAQVAVARAKPPEGQGAQASPEEKP